ncbi:MAG TPA: FixG Ig-like domain-containing protein, partial [Myxococcota bacterium]|nr:FixG Ig-like domain-containing protein [Myxococcota bacterium]
ELGVRGDAALDGLEIADGVASLEIPATTTRLVTVRVRASPRTGRGSQPIEFVIASEEPGAKAFTLREKSRFLVP